MTMNVFSKPNDTFITALESPSLLSSIIIVFLAGMIFSIITFLVSNNFVISGIIILSFFVNWIVFSIVYWLFSFMFNSKKKAHIESNFLGILTATSRLWLFLILIGVFVFVSMLGGLLTPVSGIAILVLSIIMLFYSFILMKVILDSNNGRAFIAWFLAIILYFLLNSIAFAITTAFL
ncbi:MAG: hypothetical protein PHP82_01350 [Candidatus ainarchaeum sp.]|nr:hypothetical protein [Candidatus ainarchaeum sp.]